MSRDTQLIKGKVPRLSDSNLGLAGNDADDVYCSSVRPSVRQSVGRSSQRGSVESSIEGGIARRASLASQKESGAEEEDSKRREKKRKGRTREGRKPV